MKIPVNFPKSYKFYREEKEKPILYLEHGEGECPETAKCPICKKGTLFRIYNLRIGGEQWAIFPELGCIYECDVCGRYFRYNPLKKKFEEIPYLQLVREMREVIEFLKSAQSYSEEHVSLSPELATLTYKNPETGEYWTVNEIIEACKELGIDPATATWRHTPWITAWLRKHYPRKSK